jgi:mRNA interferase RelE/StbE
VANYELLIKRSAAKELDALPTPDRRRIAAKIHLLAKDPRPPGVERLSGAEWYRLRQGDYRVLFEIDDGKRTVTIVRIGHRRDVYRQ